MIKITYKNPTFIYNDKQGILTVAKEEYLKQ